MDVLFGIRILALPVLTATLLGCVEQQGLAGPESLDAEAAATQQMPISGAADMGLKERAHNHFVCMSAYSSAITPCVDMAANQRDAEAVNEDNAARAESRSLYSAGTVTADDFAETCIGKSTDNVFGDARALEYAATNSGSLPPDNRAEKRYDWMEDDLGKHLQSTIDRIYAQPDKNAPEFLERPLARMLGHTHHGMSLLAKTGATEDELSQIANEYESNSNYNLIGRHPDQQDDQYKIKACLELL